MPKEKKLIKIKAPKARFGDKVLALNYRRNGKGENWKINGGVWEEAIVNGIEYKVWRERNISKGIWYYDLFLVRRNNQGRLIRLELQENNIRNSAKKTN